MKYELIRELAHNLVHELVSHDVILWFMCLIAFYKINLTLFLYLVIVWRNMELEESCNKKWKISKQQQITTINSKAQQMKPSNSKAQQMKPNNSEEQQMKPSNSEA